MRALALFLAQPAARNDVLDSRSIRITFKMMAGTELFSGI